jgi:hypothetical protein
VRVRDRVVLLVLAVEALGFGELVFDDDAAGGVDRRAFVDQGAGSRGQAQLVAGVATVPAGGAVRVEQFGLQAAQKVLGHADQLGCDGLDVEKVLADYRNGVLTVTVPVAEHAKPRRIPIARAAGGDRKVIEAS